MIKVGKVKNIQDMKDLLCMAAEDAAKWKLSTNALKGLYEAIDDCVEQGAE